MAKEVFEIFKIMVPILGTLGGTFLGVYFTRKTQLDLFTSETRIQKQKELSDRIEKTMKIYSEIVRADGEEVIVTRVGGHVTEFNFQIYVDKIRPIIFDGFIYIHSDVAKIVDGIDSRIAECNFNEEALTEDHLYLCSRYFELTSAIDSHLEDYRKALELSTH